MNARGVGKTFTSKGEETLLLTQEPYFSTEELCFDLTHTQVL